MPERSCTVRTRELSYNKVFVAFDISPPYKQDKHNAKDRMQQVNDWLTDSARKKLDLEYRHPKRLIKDIALSNPPMDLGREPGKRDDGSVQGSISRGNGL